MTPNSCYVSTPFGSKTDPATGTVVDFDAVYHTIVRPAVFDAGLVPVRGDEIGGAIVHKSLLEAIISADVFVADITTANPNVMYELGIRHALRRGATVVITMAGARPPYDISYIRYLAYAPEEIGEGDRSASLRSRLAAVLSESLGRHDSPVHEFFPDLQIELPPALRTVRAQMVREAIVAQLGTTPAPSVDLLTAIDMLKELRNRSDWEGVVAYADALPEPIRLAAEPQQLVALALNRRAGPGDRDRAITMMRSVIDRTGGDGETYGILGRVYKDCYAEAHDEAFLAEAIRAYRAGFLRQPTDYYLAINLITLLAMSGDQAAKDELMLLVRRVRTLMQDQIDSSRPADYWVLATALQLAVIEGDWEAAAGLGRRVRLQPAAAWMAHTTVRSLRDLSASPVLDIDLEALQRLIDTLTPGGGSGLKAAGA